MTNQFLIKINSKNMILSGYGYGTVPDILEQIAQMGITGQYEIYKTSGSSLHTVGHELVQIGQTADIPKNWYALEKERLRQLLIDAFSSEIEDLIDVLKGKKEAIDTDKIN